MTFRPSVHGWPFANTFEVAGPALGLGTVPASGFGLGGGMCWAALDRYLDGRAIPDDTTVPQGGDALHAELLRRQVAAVGGVWQEVRRWQTLPDGSWRDQLPVRLTPGRGDLTSLTRSEWRTVRRSLDRGRPILLTLVLPGDGYTRSTCARQVLAFGYTRDGASVMLAIYDPDRPGDDDFRLGFSLRGPLEARLTGGMRVRGFFAVAYDREPPEPMRAETFADRSVIGLNRKVRGRPSATVRGGTLHLLARDADGALLHFRRPRGRHWEGANVTEQEEMGAYELHSDPAALAGAAGLGLHAFARSYVGDLLHFRFGRRWRVTNRTEHRRAGARFRLEGDPVPFALPRAGTGVVARGRDGALVSYFGSPLKGWWAEEIPAPGGAGVASDPVVTRLEDTVHVFARGRNSHLLHFERTRGGWSSGDLTETVAELGPIAGPPAVLVHDERVYAFARNADGALVRVEREPDGTWIAETVPGDLAGDPAATGGPAGIHVFAADSSDGLVHAWQHETRWRMESVTGSRPALPRTPPGTRVLAWGTDEEIRVVSRGEAGFAEWVWRPDTDWMAGPLSERSGVARRHDPADDPVLARDTAGRLHLFATDGTGTVLHYEPAASRAKGEPDRPAAEKPKPRRRPQPVAAPTAAIKAALARKAAEQEVFEEPEPLPLLDDPDEVPEEDPTPLPLLDEAPEEARAGQMPEEAPDAEATEAPSAHEPEPFGLMDLALDDEPDVTADPAEPEQPNEPAARAAPAPKPVPKREPEPESEPESEPEPEPEPSPLTLVDDAFTEQQDSEQEQEPDSEEFEPILSLVDDPVAEEAPEEDPDPLPLLEPVDEEEKKDEKGGYNWDGATDADPLDLEPFDLDQMDSWPSSPSGKTGRKWPGEA